MSRNTNPWCPSLKYIALICADIKAHILKLWVFSKYFSLLKTFFPIMFQIIWCFFLSCKSWLNYSENISQWTLTYQLYHRGCGTSADLPLCAPPLWVFPPSHLVPVSRSGLSSPVPAQPTAGCWAQFLHRRHTDGLWCPEPFVQWQSSA